MATTTDQALTFTSGDDVPLTFNFTDETGTAIDITGWTLFLTIKRYPPGEVLISKDVTTHDDPVNGQTSVTLTHDETNRPELNRANRYDVQIKRGDGSILTVLNDEITFVPDVTERTDPNQ